MPKLEDMKKAELIEYINKQQEEFTGLLGEKDQLSDQVDELSVENEGLKTAVEGLEKALAAAQEKMGKKSTPAPEETKPLYWPFPHNFTEMNPPSIFGLSGTIDTENDWIEVQVPVSRVEAALSREGKRLFEKQEILDFRASQADDVIEDVDDDTFDEDSE